MNRQNQILAAVLALQIVVLAVVFWPSSAAGGERLFSELSADQIVRLTIQDTEGNQVVLDQGAEGWKLPEADDYPTEENKVVSFIDKIVGIRGDRVVAQTSGSHKRLKVADDEFERLLEFELKDGTRHKLYLGTAPRYQVLHVRPGDEDKVYLALGLTLAEVGTKPASWIDTSYFSVPQDQIVAVTLENRNGRFEFEKDDAGNWMMKDLAADETLKENNVNSLVSRVSSLLMLRPLSREEGASYGMDDPNAVVTVQTRDEAGNERAHVVRVGGQVEVGAEAGYVLKSAESPYYVLMADYTVSMLVERTRQDFLELPPTPTPEPAAEPASTPTP